MNELLTENEILSRVPGNWQQPLVSFLCVTYNQQPYIEQTIKGFLIQKTSFPYEIIIHDDNSCDGTKDIIEQYKKRYPNLIKCIIQNENQHSQGISTTSIALEQCRGRYVALCEGDDYWVSEHKIENQTQLMLNDPDVSMVVSPGKLEDQGVLLNQLHCYYGDKVTCFTAQQVIDEPWQFAPTASYLIKKACLLQSQALFVKAPVGDTFMEVYAATVGKLMYYPEVGSVYRMTAKNSWSERMSLNKNNSLAIKKTEQFVAGMQRTITNSKTIPGWEQLDWSIKLAAMHYILAVLYLKNNELSCFTKTITISYDYGKVAKQQQLLYYCKNMVGLLYVLVKPAIYLRGQFRKLVSNV